MAKWLFLSNSTRYYHGLSARKVDILTEAKRPQIGSPDKYISQLVAYSIEINNVHDSCQTVDRKAHIYFHTQQF